MVKLIYKLDQESDREKFLVLTKTAKVAIVCFSAVWCGPCKRLAMELDHKLGSLLESDRDLNDLSNLQDSIVLVKINIDEFEDLAKLYDVSSIPHVVFYKNGELQPNVVTGCQSDKIVNLATQP